jgi:hypothetical protein
MKRLSTKIFGLIILAVSVSGCFDVERNIKMYPNGGGVEELRVTLDKDFFDTFQTYASSDQTGRAKGELDTLKDNVMFYNELLADLQRTPGTSIKDLLITDKDDGAKEIYIKYSFDDPQALTNLVKEGLFRYSNQLNVIWESIKFMLDDNTLKFRYFMRKANRAYNNELALSMFSGLIASKTVTINYEFPFTVTTSNAQSTAGNLLTWTASMNDIVHNQVEMTAEMTPDEGLDLTYAEKVEKDISRVSKKRNPLIRVQVYNANKEPVKIGTGIIVDEDLLVTNFELMNIMEGRGFFSVILNNDSLAGIDEMREGDLVPSLDLVYLRFNNMEKTRSLKFAPIKIPDGTPVKILYYPNPLSSIVYSMNAKVSDTKKWGEDNKIIEIQPAKPLSLSGGAVFDEKGELVGMVTQAFNGEVGKIYVVPGLYIRAHISK